MNIVSKLAGYFGLTPPSDVDLLHEPSATTATIRDFFGNVVLTIADPSPRHGSPGVDRSAAPVEEAGAVGRHTNWDAMRDDISFVRDLMLAELAQIDDRKHALLTAVDALDNIDPTPAGLASAVVDINKHRT